MRPWIQPAVVLFSVTTATVLLVCWYASLFSVWSNCPATPPRLFGSVTPVVDGLSVRFVCERNP
jgi:hypothetical protein